MPADPCPATTTDLGQPTRCILDAGHADEMHFDGAIQWRDRAVARDVPPRLPHEWPADPRDPCVCIHGCGCEPGDVLIEDECPRRLRAALEGAVGERDRLRVAARSVIAVWDGEYEDDRMAPKIDRLRGALVGRGGGMSSTYTVRIHDITLTPDSALHPDIRQEGGDVVIAGLSRDDAVRVAALASEGGKRAVVTGAVESVGSVTIGIGGGPFAAGNTTLVVNGKSS